MGKILKAYMLRVDQNSQLVYKGYIGELEDELEALQEYVGGTIQLVHIGKGIVVLCHDEGKLIQLPPNRCWINNKDDTVIDVLVGNLACFRTCEDDLASIDESDIPYIESILKAVFNVVNGKVCIIENPPAFELKTSE